MPDSQLPAQIQAQPQTQIQERLAAIVERVQATYARWRRDTPVEQMRQDWDALFWNDSQPCEYKDTEIEGIAVRWIKAPDVNEDRVLLYFHGGGYKMGSVVSHHDLMVRLSAASNCKVLGVNYRLGPEYRFPAPIEDAVRVYQALLDQGCTPNRMAIAGDSAGGGVAAAALLEFRARQLPLPSSAVLLSAWLDMSLSGESYESRAKLDPIHQKYMLEVIAAQYLGKDSNPRNPLASPLFAEFKGLPPMLLQVGDCEVGLDDSVKFAEAAKAAGCEVSLSIWDHMIHVFQQFPDDLPEAIQAIGQIGEFVKKHFG